MKIAILIIATEKYYDNINKLKNSIDKYLFKTHNKTIFLFTDRHDIHPNITSIYITALPWPLITLMKFNYPSTIKSKLSEFDMIYYIDADSEIIDNIDEEVFPDKIGQIVATKHLLQSYNSDCYETNIKSAAYVLDSKGMHYFQACFFGGYRDDFLKMSEEINDNIRQDLKINFIAKWHDESHFNKYLIDHPPKQLSPGYAHPPYQWGDTIVDKKIIHFNNNSV